MATSWNANYVKCPFYQRDNPPGKIVCEGLTDSSTLALEFRKKAEFYAQMRTCCQSKYKSCEIYRMLARKYEEE